MALAEGRRCDGAVWLYPRDRFEVRFDPQQLRRFTRGATHFTFGARYLQKRPVTLRVTLRVDGQTLVDETFDGRDLWKGEKVWALDPPIPATAQDVVLEVENLDFVFYLLEEAALSEGPLDLGAKRWLGQAGH